MNAPTASPTKKELLSPQSFKLHLLGESLIVGVAAGLVISLYRFGISRLNQAMQSFLGQAADQLTSLLLFAGALLIGALVAGFCYQKEPLISGSGIPQVSAQLKGRLRPAWFKVLFYKFCGGLMTLGGGLTLGREGPSVQIGAALGQGLGDLMRRPHLERRYLIVSGAGAGLAAAFNAPIAGVIFALEEMHRHLSSFALVSAMVASFTANYMAGLFYGQHPVLFFTDVKALPLHFYPVILLTGLLVGLSGVLFNKLIMLGKGLYARLHLPPLLAGLLPFAVVGVACCIWPVLFGSGEHLIFLPVEGFKPLPQIVILYLTKLLLLVICFGSGLPGGIFFPLLVLGSLVGQGTGLVLQQAGLFPTELILTLSLMAMAGHFAAIVRAPLTGIILISEMTGSFANMLPLGLISLIAYLTAELCHSEPIYESLEKALHRPTKPPFSSTDSPGAKAGTSGNGRSLAEFPVEPNSPADGQLVARLTWPANLILVAVRRGSEEFIPKGDFRLQAGDYLLALYEQSETTAIRQAVLALTKTRSVIAPK